MISSSSDVKAPLLYLTFTQQSIGWWQTALSLTCVGSTVLTATIPQIHLAADLFQRPFLQFNDAPCLHAPHKHGFSRTWAVNILLPKTSCSSSAPTDGPHVYVLREHFPINLRCLTVSCLLFFLQAFIRLPLRCSAAITTRWNEFHIRCSEHSSFSIPPKKINESNRWLVFLSETVEIIFQKENDESKPKRAALFQNITADIWICHSRQSSCM